MTNRDFNFLTLENFYNKWLENSAFKWNRTINPTLEESYYILLTMKASIKKEPDITSGSLKPFTMTKIANLYFNAYSESRASLTSILNSSGIATP